MNLTTIKLHKRTKIALDRLKKKTETYDDIINRIIYRLEQKKLQSDLIEGHKKLGEEQLHLLEEWKNASNEMLSYN